MKRYRTIVFSCKENTFLKKFQSSKLNFKSFIFIYFSFLAGLYILRIHQMWWIVQLKISWYFRTKWFIDRHTFVTAGNGLFQLSSRKDSNLQTGICSKDLHHTRSHRILSSKEQKTQSMKTTKSSRFCLDFQTSIPMTFHSFPHRLWETTSPLSTNRPNFRSL